MTPHLVARVCGTNVRHEKENSVQIAAGVLSALALDPEKMKASFEYVSIFGTWLRELPC